jgi:hypothetical protein
MSEEKAKALLNEINKREDNMDLLKRYKTSDKDKPIVDQLMSILITDKNELEEKIKKLYSNKELF